MTQAPQSKGGHVPRLRALVEDPRHAIQERWIVCLICGQPFRQLTNTHLRSHGTTAPAYKQRFGYNLRRPLMSRTLLRLYTERAIRFGLAARIQRRPIVSDPELRRRGGWAAMALEESLTRREAWFTRKTSAYGKNGNNANHGRDGGR